MNVLLKHRGDGTYWRILTHTADMQMFLLGEAIRTGSKKEGELTKCFLEELLREYDYIRCDK